jgi:hypothetical protein
MSNIKKFPLTCQAGRFALLAGIAAGTVADAEFNATMLQDLEKRPYRKPVVAGGIYYASVADAARAEVGTKVRGAEAHRLIMNAVKNISNWCTADKYEGYYWAEPQ